MPPFDGPRATLCVTRQPVKTFTDPSSLSIGIETSTAFLHSPRIATRSWSTPNTSATFRSCCCAIRNGLSVVITAELLYPEGDLGPAGRPRQHRLRDDADLVASGGERRTT